MLALFLFELQYPTRSRIEVRGPRKSGNPNVLWIETPCGRLKRMEKKRKPWECFQRNGNYNSFVDRNGNIRRRFFAICCNMSCNMLRTVCLSRYLLFVIFCSEKVCQQVHLFITWWKGKKWSKWNCFLQTVNVQAQLEGICFVSRGNLHICSNFNKNQSVTISHRNCQLNPPDLKYNSDNSQVITFFVFHLKTKIIFTQHLWYAETKAGRNFRVHVIVVAIHEWHSAFIRLEQC